MVNAMITMLQKVHKISCKRRASRTHAPASQLGDVSSRLCTKTLTTLPGFYDDACKSTDTSGPEQVPDSFDGSDSDDSDIMPNSEATAGESSDLENCIMDSSSAATSEHSALRHEQGSRCLNPQAAVSVPASQNSTHHLRDSIRSVINALNEWEGSTAAEDCQPNGEVQSHTLAVLEQALSKLTPEDAAMVRTFVDAKLTQGGSHSHFQNAESSLKFPAQLPQSASSDSVPPESSNCEQPATIMRKHSAAMACSGVKHRQPARARNMQHSTAIPQDFDSKQGAKPVDRSLRANLRELTNFDPARVLMLRRVSYLGLNSQALLEAYFSQFGTVERVMVCHSRSKSVPGHIKGTSVARGLGFLVMRQTKDVDGILAYGPEHVLQGTIVTVGPYGTRELADVSGL